MLKAKQAMVALGANLSFGDMLPKALIHAAVGLFTAKGLSVEKLSNLYETPCFPAGAGPDYVNAAAIVTLRHNQSPAEVLQAFHQIEGTFGRERQQRWAGRTLDIDLLAVGDSVLPDLAGYRHWQGLSPEDQRRLAPDQLILPHPRMAERAFVLVPLAEIAADWRHPVLGQTVAEMLAQIPAEDRSAVIRLKVD